MRTKLSSIAKVARIMCFIFFSFFYHQIEAQSIQDWYNEAQDRIDTLRRGEFGVEIFDKNGQPFVGEVRVRMAKHEFAFGMSFDFYEGEIDTDVPTETQWMKAAMYKYFNYGVSGNSFKWSGIDPSGNGTDYTNFEHALDWAESVDWDLRAHTLLWGGVDYDDHHPMPKWVKDLETPEAILAACEERVRREVNRYKGRVVEYDVINEPLHSNYTQSIVGDSLNWKCFQWAREEDPDAALFINEYNVEFGWGDADAYVEMIEEILAKGAPVTGVGLQGHFWDCCRPDITDFVTQVNKIAEIGLPMRLTEYDFGGDLTEAEQAEDFIKVATVAFSHPSFNGMICWGLSDAGAWRENTGFFTADHTPKLAADTLLYFTQDLWATNFDQTLETPEIIDFDAYYGDYRIEVQFGDGWKEFKIPCNKANDGTVFQLYENEAELKPLEFSMAKLIDLDVLEVTFDQSIDQETVSKSDFRVFADNGVSITSISVNDTDDKVLTLVLDQEISIMDYATISYFPGTLAAQSGVLASAFGIEKIEIDGDLNKAPVVENYEFYLDENAAGGTLVGVISASDPEGSELSYKITLGNHLGVFGIDKTSGEIILNNPFGLDIDEVPVHELIVEVSDGMNAVAISVTIYLEEVLDAGTHAASGILIYPNPAINDLNIRSSNGFEQVTVFDLGGKQLFGQSFNSLVNEAEIKLNLEEGMYLLELSNGQSRSISRVVIKD